MDANDPSRILETLRAYWHSAALAAAIDIGVFTLVAGGDRTAREIAAGCGGSAANVERLCDYLVSLGFLRRRGSRYGPSRDAARFLDGNRPDSLVGVTGFFNAPPLTSAFANLAGRVRRRPPSRSWSSDGTLWREFARQTLPLRVMVAREAARAIGRQRRKSPRVLDVGAGGSPLGIELLRRHPGASLTVQDLAPVIPVALQHARAAGVASRVSALAGDARHVAFGGPFDLVLMVNVIEYFDARTRTRLIERVHAALAPGGTVVLQAPLQHGSRLGPSEAMDYDLLLLALGATGRPFTMPELVAQLRRAGFQRIRRRAAASIVLATKAPQG